MKAENFDLERYCARIGFSGTPSADLAGITTLMRRQLFSVPFENLDVLAGKGVSLIPEDIVEKIVTRRRGGYCYEVNGLFAMALAALQVPYQMLACRPMTYPVQRPRTHMVLLAQIEGQPWLCDLGFGSYGIRAPLRLGDADTPVAQDHDRFLLERHGEADYVLKAWVDGQWANQYGFDLWPQHWVDFMPANYLNSTHPEALFVQTRVIVLHNPEGRTILLGDRLKQVHGGVTQQRRVAPHELDAVLREHFGLHLS